MQIRRSHHCLTFSASSSRILLACKRNLKSWDSNTRHRFCQSTQLPFSTVSSAIVKLIIHLGCHLRFSKDPREEKGVRGSGFSDRQTFHSLCLVFLVPQTLPVSYFIYRFLCPVIESLPGNKLPAFPMMCEILFQVRR